MSTRPNDRDIRTGAGRLAAIAATIVVLVAGVAALGYRDPAPTPAPQATPAPSAASAAELRRDPRPSRSKPRERRTRPPVARSTAPSAVTAKAGSRVRVSTSGVWARLAACESGGRLHAVGGGVLPNGERQVTVGLYQLDTGWFGHFGIDPYTSTAAQQLRVARYVLERQGPGAWPHCGPRAGLVRGA